MRRFIYLASQSPRRSQLLDQLCVPHELLLPQGEGQGEGGDENAEALETILAGESPKAYVQRVTELKLAAAVARRARRGLPEAPILCADTTVALGRNIYGKPVNAQDAVRMLGELSGQTHRVLTAVAMRAGLHRLSALSVSHVTFSALTSEQIATYVDTGEPMGKAGAYGIQGRAGALISRLNGSYSGVMGLPLYETACLLKAANVAF